MSANAGCVEDALYRLMRFLAGRGIFAELDDGRFAQTRLSACLGRNHPASVRGWARYIGAPWYWELWSDLESVLRTGRTVHELQHGQSFFEWYDDHPDHGRAFDEAMSSFTTMIAASIATSWDFSQVETLVDVAGGQGALLAAILKAHPRLTGTLVDQPSVLARARLAPYLASPGVEARHEMVAGDIFNDLPAGKDAYLLKWILHDWTDEQALQILKTCRKAMLEPGRRVLIVELLVGKPGEPSPAKTLDIAMLALTGGRERTKDEFERLLQAAGFRLAGLHPTATPFTLIEAVAV